MSRFYINEPLMIGAQLILENEYYNYLIRVLRMQKDEEFLLFNGKGGEYRTTIIEIKKHTIIVKVKAFIDINRASKLNIHLFQALAKADKLELVFQKATELGVKSITPIITERSVLNLKSHQLESRMARWNNIIESSCEQCGLNLLPTLNLPKNLQEIDYSFKTGYTLILDPLASTTLGKLIQEIDKEIISFNIIIGPEGGLTKDETLWLSNRGVQSVSLGERILRTETAALSVISTLHGLMGDWS